MTANKKKIKIGFFIAALLNHGGGAEKHFIMMSNAMVKKGYSVGIINLNEKFYRKLSVFLSIYYFSRLTFIRYKDKEIEKMLENVDWLKVELGELEKTLQKFDVIYTKNEILDLGLLKLVGFNKLPPVIIGIHTPFYYSITSSFYSRLHNFLYLGPFYRWLLKDCKAIRVSSSDVYNLVKNYYPRFKNKIFKILNPIDLKKFKTLKKQKVNKDFRILFVGRLTEQKGVDMLVKIIESLSLTSIFKELYFTIAGSGDMENLIDSLQKKFPNVSWLGHVPQDDMPQLYLLNDIVLAPSRWEALSNVIIEAQSCGVPVIASNIPGSNNVVINDKTGFLVENSPELFISKIKYFYHLKKTNGIKFMSFKDNARTSMEKKFNSDKIFNQLEDMFIRLAIH